MPQEGPGVEKMSKYKTMGPGLYVLNGLLICSEPKPLLSFVGVRRVADRVAAAGGIGHRNRRES
jgi:hypothetical protein